MLVRAADWGSITYFFVKFFSALGSMFGMWKGQCGN